MRVFQKQESEAREKAQQQRDNEWRSFLAQQRETDQRVSESMKESLDGLTAIISRLVDEVQGSRVDFQSHDAMERAKLDEMSATIHERPKKAPKA